MKQATTLLLLSFVLVFSGKLVWAGHDYNHITFINQTKHKIKFTVDIQDGWNRHDISKTLHSHTANYINVDQTEEHCMDDGKKRKLMLATTTVMTITHIGIVEKIYMFGMKVTNSI